MSRESYAARGLLPEHERECFAIGALTEGAAGQARKDSALEQLRAMGFVDPLADVRAYFPELVVP